MRVLHVLDHSVPAHSGYSFRTRSILKHQRARGWETDHLTSAKQPDPSVLVEDVDGLRFHRTLPSGGPVGRLPVLRQISVLRGLRRRLFEVAKETQPDVLHAHSPCITGLAALTVGRRLGLPVVYEVRAFWEDAAVDHGTTAAGSLRYRLTRRLETRVLRRADAVTCICEGLKSDIVGRGLPSEKVTVIPNAVDISHYSMDATRDPALETRYGLANRTVLGFLGSFYSYEGLSLLLDAMPAVLERRPGVRLLLVGGGSEEEALRSRVGELGIANRVIFTGRVPHDEVHRYYSLVDICVYPRLPIRLTDLVTPLKPLEAMAQGRLVVASDVGGHRELLRDGETGLLFRAGDRAALKSTILDMLSDPARACRMRAAARRFVETERSWEASVARYEPVYNSLAGRS